MLRSSAIEPISVLDKLIKNKILVNEIEQDNLNCLSFEDDGAVDGKLLIHRIIPIWWKTTRPLLHYGPIINHTIALGCWLSASAVRPHQLQNQSSTHAPMDTMHMLNYSKSMSRLARSILARSSLKRDMRTVSCIVAGRLLNSLAPA